MKKDIYILVFDQGGYNEIVYVGKHKSIDSDDVGYKCNKLMRGSSCTATPVDSDDLRRIIDDSRNKLYEIRR